MRSRLLLLIAVPVLVAVVFGGVAIVSSLRTAQSYQQVQRLAVLAGDATNLAQALQTEREDTVNFIAGGNNGGRASAMAPANASNAGPNGPKAEAAGTLALLQSDYKTSGRFAAQVSSLAATIGGSYPALAQTQAQAAITAIGDLSSLRTASTTTRLPVLTVIDDYGTIITQLLALENEVSAGSKDASLADTVQVTSLISSMKEEASEQQAIVTSALRPDQQGAVQLGSESLTVLNEAAAEQAANLSAFDLSATAAQRQVYNTELSSALAAEAQQELQQAAAQLASNTTSASDPAFVVATGNASYITSALGSVERQLTSSIIAQSGSLHNSATETALIEGAGVLLLLVLALVLIALVGQSMIGPLRRLRAGALEIAGVRLPETVRLMAETDGEGVSLDVEPIDVDSADEIGEVARAFDQVHREALRLAANEAALRGNVNAMFVNLSRRSQSLVERQIRLIDSLEQGEQDSKRLASLFQMDHLATRMRRNSENLLVLAGQDLSRRWNRPVALVDVLRAALSEIERYERVTLNVQPGIAVRAQAVSDVVHLTAELVENATSFSAADSPVTIAGHLLGSGGALLEIADQGVGMEADEMAHANWRLDNPPVVDVAVSRRMGLFVVARLAARHGIRVRLRHSDGGGLVALVWLPDEAITRESQTGPMPRRRPGDSDHSGAWPVVDGASAGTGEHDIGLARRPRFAPLRTDGDMANSGPTPVTGPHFTAGVHLGDDDRAAARVRGQQCADRRTGDSPRRSRGRDVRRPRRARVIRLPKRVWPIQFSHRVWSARPSECVWSARPSECVRPVQPSGCVRPVQLAPRVRSAELSKLNRAAQPSSRLTRLFAPLTQRRGHPASERGRRAEPAAHIRSRGVGLVPPCAPGGQHAGPVPGGRQWRRQRYQQRRCQRQLGLAGRRRLAGRPGGPCPGLCRDHVGRTAQAGAQGQPGSRNSRHPGRWPGRSGRRVGPVRGGDAGSFRKLPARCPQGPGRRERSWV